MCVPFQFFNQLIDFHQTWHDRYAESTQTLIPFKYPKISNNRDSAASIVTGYGLGNQDIGDRVLVVARIFTSVYRPDGLWV